MSITTNSKSPILKETYEDSLTNMERQLVELEANKELNRGAPVGSTIYCANCGKPIPKKRYQTVFCSNVKTHGSDNCKDKFHNRVKGLKYRLLQAERERV